MNQVACSYAALRFLPYRETGEFANVGVVVWAPEVGLFAYRCNPLYKRLKGFFPELDASIYRTAIQGVKAQLMGVEKQFAMKTMAGEARHTGLVNRFHEFVRTREGLMIFSPAGAMLADSVDQALDTLYQRLVLRQFAEQPEYQETVMRKRLADNLKSWNLSDFYRHNIRVGDERFHLTAPFAHMVAIKAHKILRPLDLDKKDPTSIYRHGDQLAIALRRLREFCTLPEHVVIPVRLPHDGERLDAAQRVVNDFRAFGAQTMPLDDHDAVRKAVLIRAA